MSQDGYMIMCLKREPRTIQVLGEWDKYFLPYSFMHNVE